MACYILSNEDIVDYSFRLENVKKHGFGYCLYLTVPQPRTQGFLLPRLDGQLKRPWLRLVCFAT
jgi:hypothetical protein